MPDLIRILKSVDAWTPPPPLGHRFLLAACTWIDRDGDSVEPWALVRLVMPRLAELVDAHEVVAEYWIRKRRGIFRRRQEELHQTRPWADIMCQSDLKLESSADFPDRITLTKQNTLAILVQTTFWNRVGGPTPYHDSVTLTFSSPYKIQNQLEEALVACCETLDITPIRE